MRLQPEARVALEPEMTEASIHALTDTPNLATDQLVGGGPLTLIYKAVRDRVDLPEEQLQRGGFELK